MTTGIKKNAFLLLILLIASFLRFYNLMHDSPYFFNPDERNMANAISRFKLPRQVVEIPNCLISQIKPVRKNPQSETYNQQPTCNLNPDFFAYGQFPLYLAFLSDQISSVMLNLFQHPIKTLKQVQGDPSTALQPITNDYLSTSHTTAIFWLRFWSASSSVLSVLLIYMITKEIIHYKPTSPQPSPTRRGIRGEVYKLSAGACTFACLAALLAAFSPGLIQSAHFGTTESLLTFFFLASTYFSMRIISVNSRLSRLSHLGYLKHIFILSVVVGLAIGTKFTGVIFLAPPLISLFIKTIQALKGRKKNKTTVFLLHCFIVALLIISSVTLSILFSPFNVLDTAGFKGSVFGYEADVATGRYEAFYTRQFVNTTPVLFQAEKIFPYALGWPIFILGTVGFLFIIFKLLLYLILSISVTIKNSKLKIKNDKLKIKNLNFELSFCVLLFAFCVYFFPNAFLFAKWTRFMTPIFPFFSIFAGCFLFTILSSRLNPDLIGRSGGIFSDKTWRITRLLSVARNDKLIILVIGLLVFISILPGIAFMPIYAREDVRVTASRWILQNIPDKSNLLFETANVIDIPLYIPDEKFPEKTFSMVSFDYYHIDENKELFQSLLREIEKADYIFIPSRRIFANYLRLPQKYPLYNKYYQLLQSGALGFERVAEFSSFPQLPIGQIGPIGNDESAEESFTVFDHPVIRIYQKNKLYNLNYYRDLFN